MQTCIKDTVWTCCCFSLPNLTPFSCSSLPTDDATRVILKSTDDYINANYINVSYL